MTRRKQPQTANMHGISGRPPGLDVCRNARFFGQIAADDLRFP